MKFIDALLGGAVVFVMVVLLYFLLVLTPVRAWADGKCAERGFPEVKVTWNLDAYCMNLDGAVTTKMEKLK